jgi:hypothetical protein
VKADGSGGYTISETDDLSAGYADVLAYSEFLTFTVTPLLKIDDAVPAILAYLG